MVKLNLPEIGKAYRYGPNKIHILAEIEGHFVYKYWRRHKKRWDYCIESPWFFHYAFDMGVILPYPEKRRKRDEQGAGKEVEGVAKGASEQLRSLRPVH